MLITLPGVEATVALDPDPALVRDTDLARARLEVFVLEARALLIAFALSLVSPRSARADMIDTTDTTVPTMDIIVVATIMITSARSLRVMGRLWKLGGTGRGGTIRSTVLPASASNDCIIKLLLLVFHFAWPFR
jgi:hypothetical protein